MEHILDQASLKSTLDRIEKLRPDTHRYGGK